MRCCAVPRPMLVGLLIAGSLGACNGKGRGGGEVRTSTVGDTTFVTIPAGFDTSAVRVDSIETLWHDQRLGRPTTMASVGGRLVIGDQDRIHILRADGSYVGTYGRAGQGPREFGNVVAVGGHDGRIVVLDVRNIRYAILDSTGDFLSTHLVAWPEPYVNPSRSGEALRFWGGGVLRVADENVHLDRATRSALVWESLTQDSSKIIQEWDDVTFVRAGGLIAPDSVYPGRAIVAVANDGRVAFGDGLAYCVSIEQMGESGVMRVCRDRERAKVGPGVRNASLKGVEVPSRLRDGLETALREQVVGELIPSYDQLTFSEEGLLWVRAMGRDTPDVHPIVLSWLPEPYPPYRRWEALDRDGRPAGAVIFPGRFDPRIFDGRQATGFLELETGEVVVARAVW